MKKFYIYFVLFNITIIAIIHFLSDEKVYKYSWNNGSAYNITSKATINDDNFSLISTFYVKPILENNELYLFIQFRPFDFAINSLQDEKIDEIVDAELILVKATENGEFTKLFFPPNFDNKTVEFLSFLLKNLSAPIDTTHDSYNIKTDTVSATISREFWLSSLEYNDNKTNTIHLSATNMKIVKSMKIFREQRTPTEIIEGYNESR